MTGIYLIWDWFWIDQGELFQYAVLEGFPMFSSGLVYRQIQSRPDEKRLFSFDRVIATVELQAQEGFLDEIVGVIDTAAAAAKQAAELDE